MLGARDWQLNRDPLATICAANRAIGAPFGEDAHLRQYGTERWTSSLKSFETTMWRASFLPWVRIKR